MCGWVGGGGAGVCMGLMVQMCELMMAMMVSACVRAGRQVGEGAAASAVVKW